MIVLTDLKAITREQWKTLVAAQLGWMLDAMDVMLYAFALNSIQKEFDLSSGQAGALASVTLIASAIGGIGFGVLADRIGRARSLISPRNITGFPYALDSTKCPRTGDLEIGRSWLSA